MTDARMNLRTPVEKTPDADILRGMHLRRRPADGAGGAVLTGAAHGGKSALRLAQHDGDVTGLENAGRHSRTAHSQAEEGHDLDRKSAVIIPCAALMARTREGKPEFEQRAMKGVHDRQNCCRLGYHMAEPL